MVLRSFVCTLAALFDAATGVTAPNFPVAGGNANLTLAFGNNTVSPPGELLPRAGIAIILLVDTDVPRNGTRVQLLHWMIGNVTLSSSGSELVIPPESAALATYRQPSPPIGDVAHAYTALLFAQPDNFSVPAQFTDVLQSRVFFDTAAFVEAAGLGSPIAANYFRVQNTSGTATQSFPPPASTPTNGTTPPAQFPGGAVMVGERAWLIGVGTAVVAGLIAVLL
ncbi:PEBP-like protein [Lentithecium fluviatile CBS 122367]|uniref:PEBP-like protein n=1 Tax=Lentithecium fluviatile CBS 122367 TaxID=1168545 RepID=A0A6G1J5M2_9PLEO|nr:PEBP-like protein [Lentithecium fluviatile CBS 122367]